MIRKEPPETYAVVGELVLTSSALDVELNKVVSCALRLGGGPLLLPVLGTLDTPRKIEMLRARVSHMPLGAVSWRQALLQFLDHVETVNRYRELACRVPILRENGWWIFELMNDPHFFEVTKIRPRKSPAGGWKTDTQRAFVRDLKRAITLAERALHEAVLLRLRIDEAAEKKPARRAAIRSRSRVAA